MIKATVDKGEVTCGIEGRGIQIMSELTVLVDSVLDKMTESTEMEKVDLVNLFCKGLNHINEKEN